MSVYRDLLKKEQAEEVRKSTGEATTSSAIQSKYPYPQDLMHMVDRVIDAEYRTISITSAREGAGASFVAKEFSQVLAQNLAKSIVRDDKARDRVLLVEVRLDKKRDQALATDLDSDSLMAQTMMYNKDQYPGVDYIAAVPLWSSATRVRELLVEFSRAIRIFLTVASSGIRLTACVIVSRDPSHLPGVQMLPTLLSSILVRSMILHRRQRDLFVVVVIWLVLS